MLSNLLQKASNLKEEGNLYFRNKEFLSASTKYSEALKTMESVSSEDANGKKLILNLYVNRAACNLKLAKYENCLSDCSSVLMSTDNSFKTKALYRRAQAFAKMKSWKESRTDLLALLKDEPNNTDAQQLMREVIGEMQKGSSLSEVERFFSGLKSSEEDQVVQTIKGLTELCGEDELHAYQFGYSGGVLLLERLVPDTRYEVYCAKFLAVLTKHRKFVKNFINMSVVASFSTSFDLRNAKFNVSSSGTTSFYSLFEFFQSAAAETVRAAILIIMNVLRALPLQSERIIDSNEGCDSLREADLFLNRSHGEIVLAAFRQVLEMRDPKHFKFACEAFSAFISEQPNYYDTVKPVDTRLETLEERKQRLQEGQLLIQRSRLHSTWAIKIDYLRVLIESLGSKNQTIHVSASSTLGKLIKCYNNNEDVKLRIQEMLQSVQPDLESIKNRAILEISLLFSHPELGSWVLEQANGIQQLLHLIDAGEEKSLEIASEVLCLAANVDSAAVLVKPLIEQDILDRLLASTNPTVKANAAAALTKLSIKSKSLKTESPENARILNSVLNVLKNSHDSAHQINPVSLERCIETLAALASKTYVKEEIMYGSHRLRPIISEIMQVTLPEDSVAYYGLSYLFSCLTVTNRELKAIALADKEITLEQYEKLQELQRIKGKDDNGELFEEKKEEVDVDTQDLCNKRIGKLVSLGIFSILFRLLRIPSTQIKENVCRTLRQICVVESARGIFLQDGGLRICSEITNDESLEKKIRFEAAHALAKSLVTTNPNLLNEHHRLNAFRPLLFLCREVDATQLQQFEALLSLTNLLSCGAKEQNLFVDEKGVAAVHYLMFSNNFMVRRAATEAICNLGGHEAILQVLRDVEKLKLWLALVEDWDPADGTSSEGFLSARAALGTLAMTCFDVGVANAMIAADFCKTYKFVLTTNNKDLVHRVLVSLLELLDEGRENIGIHLLEGQFLDTLADCTAVVDDLRDLAESVMKALAHAVKKVEI